MHGITLTTRPSDWEIIQQENGFGSVLLEGSYQVHPAAIEVGVENVRPVYRVMNENDNTCVIPWTEMDHQTNPDFSGVFSHTAKIPAGGLYRIETSLDTKSTVPEVSWLYRGDTALHIGVGNLFLIAGQSNSAGHSWDYALDPPTLGVHLFRNRGVWDLATHPMNESTGGGSLPNEEMGIPGVSPYLSFGRNFQNLSRCPVGLVQTALGGSPLSRWLPESGDLYQNMLNRIALTKGNYAGVLWYQGCSDTDPDNAPLYYERFCRMVESLRKSLGYDIPFFTFQLNRQVDGLHDECWGIVREAQRRAAKEIPGVYILPTVNCSISDGIHNSAHANVMLGEKLAKLCAHILYGQESFFAPELSGAVLEEPKVLKLTFANMRLGFVMYSGAGENSGFSMADEDGEIIIESLHSPRECRNTLYLHLSREPKPDALLSFCSGANPTMVPPVDEVTYLPPLAFDRIPIFKN